MTLRAAAYPARLETLVLCATASRIGTAEVWETRIAAVEEGGMPAITTGVLERWFTPQAHTERPELVKGFRTMLERTPAASYVRACRAIRDADLRADDAKVRCPTLVIAGSGDAVTTPAMWRACSGANTWTAAPRTPRISPAIFKRSLPAMPGVRCGRVPGSIGKRVVC
jgi:3-oxoadipate enol-lactonase